MEQVATAGTEPASLCLLRTSAIGDVTHVVPMVRTLQAHWPGTRLTWLIGKLEHKLVGDLPGVEFIVFDKHAGRAGHRAVREQLAGRRFDALLHMQVAMRSNLLSLSVKAPLRIGYDRARSKDLHGLFVNCRIAARHGQHVLDAMASFLEPLGLRQTEVRWDIPIPDEAHAFAERHLPGDAPTLLVSPVSSHRLRNWRPERYAAVMDHAALTLGWRVVLCGGPSAFEREFADAILAGMGTRSISSARTRSSSCSPCCSARRSCSAPIPARCTWPMRSARPCSACTRRATRCAAAPTPTANGASIAMMPPRASSAASRPMRCRGAPSSSTPA
jgi:heptosyltransferase I